jgi:hypothetical protein
MQIPSKKTKKFEFFYFGADGPAGRHLTGQKGFQGVPYAQGHWPFLQSAGPRRTAIGRLRTAACVLICSHLRRNSLITCTLPQGYDTIILINRFYQLKIILEYKIWK